jgi:uncharacterized protein
MTPRMSGKLCASAFGNVMGAEALVDSGAIVGLLNKSDQWHGICQQTFEQLRLPLLTSLAVLTEVFYFAQNSHRMEAAWTFIRSGALQLADIGESELPHLHALMSRYWNRPMDFADATLVYLAKRESLTTIFTVDRADFETYRIEGQRKFRILPAARP